VGKTVLANPGSIGVSFEGVTDEFKIVANTLMLTDRLLSTTTKEDDVIRVLKKNGIDPTPTNIEKVKSIFSPDHDWS